MNVIEFRLDGRTYALLIEHVLEVLRMVAITPLPEGPEAVLGVINVRGKSVPVVSLASRLGVEPPPYHPDTYLLLLGHGQSTMAVPVHDILGVQDVATEEVEAPPSAGLSAALVGGVVSRADEQILVLDPVVLFDAGLAEQSVGADAAHGGGA